MSKRSVRIIFQGQVRGGKNNIGITRQGRRYPKPEWVKWRTDWMAQLAAQGALKADLRGDLRVCISYTPSDLRRRDLPAILDAVWHVLEKSEVVKDDAQLSGEVHFFKLPLDRQAPKFEIHLEERV